MINMLENTERRGIETNVGEFQQGLGAYIKE